MNNFEIFLNEGLSSKEHTNIDEKVWMTIGSSTPVLNDEIYTQIMFDMQDVSQIAVVKECYVVGDILTKMWADDTDIDVIVIFDKDMISDIAYEKLIKFLKGRENVFAGHTQHKLRYHFQMVTTQSEIDEIKDNTPGIYDVGKRRWIKIPTKSAQDIADKISIFMGRIRQVGIGDESQIDWKYFLDVDKSDIEQLKASIMSKAYALELEMSKQPKNIRDIFNKYIFDNKFKNADVQELVRKGKLPTNIANMVGMRCLMNEYIRRLSEKNDGVQDDYTTENPSTALNDDLIPESKSIESFSSFISEKTSVYNPLKVKKPGSRRGNVHSKLSGRKTYSMSDKGKNKKMIQNSGLMYGDKLADDMKSADFGCVPITSRQTKDIEMKYGLTHPDSKYPFRRLGKTDGMAIIRNPPSNKKPNESFYLMKMNLLKGMSGGIKK